MWIPYQERNKRLPDFLVEYRFLKPEDGGRAGPPYQGYRSDLHYEGEDINKQGLYCVWPEFLDENGAIIREENVIVPEHGKAYMWILFFEEMWEYHAKNAVPGRKCWFMEGSRKVAEVNIIEQISLTHLVRPRAANVSA
ncbi:MAG TPA: hypothetical protein DCO68_09655 [Methylophilaceae bacterium]|nr:hypothetical protein [Methylophilaceae bacterium]